LLWGGGGGGNKFGVFGFLSPENPPPPPTPPPPFLPPPPPPPNNFGFYDLLTQENLSPNLAILKLIVTPENEVISLAQRLLGGIETTEEFQQKLDLVEAILVNKFPKLSIEEIQKMLDLREADITKTRFYQEVLQIGRREGEQSGLQIGRREGEQFGLQIGEANMVIRQLTRRCGRLTTPQTKKVRSLALPQLELLGEALLDFKNVADLESWFKATAVKKNS
jgi:predicted transposase YdaD